MSDSDSAADLQVTCEVTSPVIRTLSVEVPQDRVQKAFDATYGQLARTASVKGFRPGKAPRSVLEKMYGASVPEEIERLLVSETIGQALEQADVEALSQPDIEADRPAAGAPFKYSARVEVKPEIELPDLEGLAARRPKVEVTDEEVEERLTTLQERQVQWVEEAEGVAAAEKHTVTIDFVGKVDGEPFEGGTGTDMDVEIGSGNLIPGFEEQLVGVVAGEDRKLNVRFPEDYGEASLAGQEAVFEIHATAVKRREVPALDDEFAKDLSDEFETLQDLRDRLRSDMNAERDRSADQVLKASVVDSLLERCEFDVPPGVVERQLQNQLESMHRQYQDQVPHDVLHQQLARMQEEGRPAAERRVREAFVLESVAKARGLETELSEVEERLQTMAAAQGVNAPRFLQMAEEQGLRDAISAEIREQKALDFLTSEATVEEFVEDENEPSE